MRHFFRKWFPLEMRQNGIDRISGGELSKSGAILMQRPLRMFLGGWYLVVVIRSLVFGGGYLAFGI